MNVVEWLLDSDPAIRWQVLGDLVDAPREIVAAERVLTASEGWCARILALQGEYPSARVILVSGDINIQNKADAALIQTIDL